MRTLILTALFVTFALPALSTGLQAQVAHPVAHHPGGVAPGGCHVHTDCCRRWVPGHWRNVSERVFVPGRVTRHWCPPVYRWRRVGCRRVRVCVRPGRWEVRRAPGCWRVVTRRVWEPGRHVLTCGL